MQKIFQPVNYPAWEVLYALRSATQDLTDVPALQLVTNGHTQLDIRFADGMRSFPSRHGSFNAADIDQIICSLVPEPSRPDVIQQVVEYLASDTAASKPPTEIKVAARATVTLRKSPYRVQRTLGDALAEMMCLQGSAVEHQPHTISPKYHELVRALSQDSMDVIANIGLVIKRDPLSIPCDDLVARINEKCPRQGFQLEQFLGLILEPGKAFQMIRQNGQIILQPVQALRSFAQTFDKSPQDIFPLELCQTKLLAALRDRGHARPALRARQLVPA